MASSPAAVPIAERPSSSGSQDISNDSSCEIPFVMTPHGDPQFSPIKLETKYAVGGTDTTVKLPKTAPEKPLAPYSRYFRQVWDEVKAAHQELKLKEISKIIHKMWRDLPDGNKQEFVEEYETEKTEHERTLKAYQNSRPAYQATLAAAKSCVSIPPLQTATVVAPPDPPVVVHSLTMHQKKLETELQQIEEKFDSKKRKFVESSSVFQEDLVRKCRKPIDGETFQSMVEQQTEIIKEERERERERQAELMREREAAAAVAALQAEKETAIAAAAAAAAAASAPTPPTPVEPMEMDDASSAMVKDEPQIEGIVSMAAPLEIKPEKSTLAPAVNQETGPFAPVPIETEEIKPSIAEPVKVEEPKCEESPAAGPPPAAPTPAIDTPPMQAAPVVEVAPSNPVEATPVAPVVMEHAPAVEAPLAVQAAPVAEPPSVIQVVGTPTQSTSKEERKMSRGAKQLLKNREKKMAAKAAKKAEKKEEPNPYWTEPDGFEANISFPRKKQ